MQSNHPGSTHRPKIAFLDEGLGGFVFFFGKNVRLKILSSIELLTLPVSIIF